MRLLEIDSNNKLSLTKDLASNIPAYAILSHTWGDDGQEFTFEDLVKGAGKLKPGYRKIRFCGDQAARDGLRYFWVDTCCIDKSDAAELQSAINSMFLWYKNAARCYVYLPDVLLFKENKVQNSYDLNFEIAFRASRWFTRGWTLQELVAPSSVEFFSTGYQRIGDKKSLERLIHEVTGIPVEVFQGYESARYSFEDKLSWVTKRQTKKEEDMVYSLLGIFGVFLPLNYGEGRDNALRRLRDEVERCFPSGQYMEISCVGILPADICFTERPAWIVPFERNSRFTGRQVQLTEVEEKLLSGGSTRTAIVGLGGVGKTQLALELAYQVRDKYRNCSVIWIPATNTESLHQAYLNVARQLGIAGCEDTQVDVKRLVKDHLSKESAGQWLLVFDNADDINMWTGQVESKPGSEHLIDYLPKSKYGCVLFTSRDRKTAVKLAQQNVIQLTEMGEDIATQLLQKCLIDPGLVNDKSDTKTLLQEVTYLPLAIVQAAAYINENGIAIADYLLLLADQEEEVIELLSEEFGDHGRYRNVKNPVATTWLISFQQIQHRDPLAADYLSFMCCIDPKDIPQSLLPPGLSRKKEIDAIGTLDAYSFISKRPADQALDLHRLVHLSTRNWLRKEDLLAQWTESVVERLEDVFPDDDHNNRSIWRVYLPHARCVLDSRLVDQGQQSRMRLLWRYATCLSADGRWDEAEAAHVEGLEIEKRELGADHPSTLTSMTNLASTYRNQGRWDAAEKLELRQVMETSKTELGADHPDTLTSMANLASMYRNQGQWDAAEALELQVMETRKTRLGADHPSTLTSMANLASTFWDQGRWEEAEKLELQVMETRKMKLGADHPSTLASMNNLAITWKSQGRVDNAVSLMEECVILQTQTIGINHPNTSASQTTLLGWQTERLRVSDMVDDVLKIV
ncbi:HET-domain-containing protein [Cadophora sp. DSE1049]|nr:HET-domain-containing protein [Cadophora sp. DSE1049]